jgi:hypothetical protein
LKAVPLGCGRAEVFLEERAQFVERDEVYAVVEIDVARLLG